MKKALVLAALIASAVGVLAGTATRGSSSTQAPPATPWVNPDGSVDVSKMPATFTVVGTDGQELRCTNGQALRISKADLMAPPVSPGMPMWRLAVSRAMTVGGHVRGCDGNGRPAWANDGDGTVVKFGNSPLSIPPAGN